MTYHILLLIVLSLLPFTSIAADSLLYLGNKRVTSVQEWETTRRQQLKQLVQQHIYGFMPAVPIWQHKIIAEHLLKERNIRYREVEIQLYKDGNASQTIHLALFTPLDKSTTVPVVLSLNKCGNLAISSIKEVPYFNDRFLHSACKKIINKQDGNTEALRDAQSNFWALDTLIKRGYAFATFHESDIAGDVSDFNQGIFKFYPELKSDTSWGVIAAWAWGLQRAVDYLHTDKLIDTNKIILYGHSRRGKAALLAAALDERVDMVVPHQSGTGGMALSKAHPLESIGQITRTFPHWFSGRFKQYAGKTKNIPLDQHYLAALIAPRPLLETIGTLDIWSSFNQSYKTLQLVSPVYQLYGKNGLVGKGKISKRGDFKTTKQGQVAQVRLPYKHDMNSDYWNFIMDYANIKLCDCE